ncbi:osmoprotectant transporter permease [Runella sp.]|uniref:osmoprotectant transporter permease n=1 Tax=Runella sp. TaxID=1960881 RepID=UPI002621B1EA|nr:osmoprotectant transporter permease [Runella sp.]
MTFFWTLWSFDALLSLIVLYFFFVGLADGSVSSFNMGLWLLILAVVGAVMLGSLWMKSNNYLSLAKSILGIFAVPGLLYGLFIVIMMTENGRWN